MSKDSINFSPSREVIQEEISSFGKDESQCWMLFGYVENQLLKGVTNTISLLKKSSTPLTHSEIDAIRNDSDSISGILSPSSSNYFIIRTKPNRYAFVQWLGNKTRALQKTKALAHRTELKDFAEKILLIPFASECNGVNEIEKLSQFVDSDNGNTSNNSSTSTSSLNKNAWGVVNKTPSNNNTTPPTNRLQRSGSKPKLNIAAQMKLVLKIDDSEVIPLLKSRKFGWLLLGYNEQGLLKIENQGEEQNVFPTSLVSNLTDDDIQFIVLKWNLTNTGYGSDVEKTFFIVWVGKHISSIRRGKVNQHKNEVYELINKNFLLGGEVTITTDEELNVEYVTNLMLGKRGNANSSSTTQQLNVVQEQSKPLERKNSELLSKIKSGFKSGKLKTIGHNHEDNTTITSPKKNSGGSLTSPRRKGGFGSFTIDNLDKISQSIGISSPQKKAVKKVTNLSQGQNTIKIEEEKTAIEKLYSVKDMFDSCIWVLFGYPGKSLNSLIVKDTGSQVIGDCINRIGVHLTDDGLSYFIHKFYVERNDRVESKFRIVIWRGPSVKAYYKAICVAHASKLATTISPVIPSMDGEPIIVSDFSQFNDLRFSTNGMGVELNPVEALKRLQVKIEEKVKPQEPIKRSPSLRKAGTETGITGGLSINDEETLIEKLKELQSDSNPLSWVMITYHSAKVLKCEDSGNGDLEEFKPKLQEDKVYYILYKQFLEQLGGAPKIVLIAYVGQNVKPVVKANSTPHRIALFKYCAKFVTLNSEFQASHVDDIDSEAIYGKVTGSKVKMVGSTTPRAETGGVLAKTFGGKSQNLVILDEKDVVHALKDLKSDTSLTTWVKFSYKGTTELFAEETGNGGLSSFTNKLSNDAVHYVLFKTFVEHSPKIVLIAWVGPGVTAGTAKARTATHQLELSAFVNKILTVASLYQAAGLDDLQEELVHKKIAGSTTISAPTAISKGTFGGRDSTLKFNNDKEVDEAFKDLRGNTPTKWLLFEYVSKDDMYTVHVAQKGPGGVDNFKQYLTSDKICYVVMRLSFIEYGEVAKAIVISWVGENSPSFLKAVSSGHRHNLQEHARKFISIGGQFQPDTLDELTDEALVAKITGSKQDNTSDSSTTIQAAKQFERERVLQVQPKIEVKDKSQFTGEFKAIEFQGKEEIKKSLLELSDICRKEQQDKAIDDANNVHYIKLKLVGKDLREVVVDGMGDGALTEEWCKKHLDANECFAFVFGLFTSEGGYGMMTKYVFVQWIGSDVKHLLKAKANELRQSLYNFVHEVLYMSGEVQGCTKPEHLTMKIVMEKITGSNVRGSNMKLVKKDDKFKGLGKEKKSKLVISDEPKLMHLIEDMILQDYLTELEGKEEVTEDEDEWRNHKRITEGKLDWIMMSYKEGSIDEIQVSNYGEGDVEAFKKYLTPSNVCFLIIRVFHAQGYAKDVSMLTKGRINLEKPYYTLIYWKGEEVQVLEKALTSHHFNAFQKVVNNKFSKMKASTQGSTYQAEKYEELNMERIKKIMRLYD
ncbi:hypothetical protein ABK040_011917 [Willaertia magna]